MFRWLSNQHQQARAKSVELLEAYKTLTHKY